MNCEISILLCEKKLSPSHENREQEKSRESKTTCQNTIFVKI